MSAQDFSATHTGHILAGYVWFRAPRCPIGMVLNGIVGIQYLSFLMQYFMGPVPFGVTAFGGNGLFGLFLVSKPLLHAILKQDPGNVGRQVPLQMLACYFLRWDTYQYCISKVAKNIFLAIPVGQQPQQGKANPTTVV